jgi:RNA polymerase sigma-70 factor (ECF subfamily)
VEAVSVVAGVEPVVSARSASDRQQRLLRVFHRGGDALYRFVLVRVYGDRDAADELLQQTCHEAARSRKMPEDDAECEAWLRGIARNLIRRHWRRTKKRRHRLRLEDAELSRQLVEDMETRPLPPDLLVREESTRQLLLALTTLPAGDQQLLFAFYFDGRSHTDIAQDAGVSVKSVEMRLYRARARLREQLRHSERT